MPFTPVHMGPGLLIKAALQTSFSLMVFGWAQIVMDMQPLLVLITGEGHLHGFSHTYIGALLLGAFSALTGKYLSEWGLRILGVSKVDNPLKITWRVSLLSAFIGTFSHVLLDSIVHTDMQPFYPFSTGNGLLGFFSTGQLHHLCLYSAIIGALMYFIIQLASKPTNTRSGNSS